MTASPLSDLIITNIRAINRINLMPREPVYRENRDRWALAIKTAGRTIYKAHGREYLSDASHVVLLPQGATYSWFCREPGECLMFEFDSDSDPLSGDPVSIRINNLAEIIGIAHRLEQLWIFKKPACIVKCLAGLYDILTRLAEAELLTYQVTAKHKIILPAVNFLETHYNQPGLNNDQLAAMAGISTVYFRKIFAGIYHISPMKYVQLIRIAKARDMLLGDYCPVGNVAAAVGFESIYHFSKTFRQVTGHTPTEYARLHRVAAYDISSGE